MAYSWYPLRGTRSAAVVSGFAVPVSGGPASTGMILVAPEMEAQNATDWQALEKHRPTPAEAMLPEGYFLTAGVLSSS